MKITDIKKRILWFSDIHFLEDSIEEYLQKFLDEFYSTCKELNEEQKIDYVIISGDLTNKGTKAEFDKFGKNIIEHLFKVISDSKLLVVPGNHDLTISKSIDYEKFRIINNPENKNVRVNFFKKDAQYKSFFTNYTKFCKKYKKYFPEAFVNYSINNKTDFLYGYHKDKENNLLFILLNSAWLSLSVNFLIHILKEEYIQPLDTEYKNIHSTFKSINRVLKLNNTINKDYIKNLGFGISRIEALIAKSEKKLVENAYEISYQTIEYGTQELFLNYIYETLKDLNKFLDENNNYLITTILHHSENHLTWNERMGDDSLFKHLKEKSDIVLSSHEHVPIDYHQVHNVNETLHLKSGPFIELKFIKNEEDRDVKDQFDYYNEDNLKKSTFSILDINVTKKKVTESRYAYNPKNMKWYNVDIPNRNSVFQLSVDKIKLNHSRIQKVYTKVKELQKPIDFLEKIVNTYIQSNVKLTPIEKTIYSFGDNLIIFNPESTFNNNGDENLVSKIVNNEYKKVFFCAIDVMIKSNDNIYSNEFVINKFYKNQDQEQLIALGNLKKEVFKRFNKYRATFFNNLSSEDSKKLNKVSFILILLPYWEIERILPP